MQTYFTVVIPWSKTPTPWHPTTPIGPFATLTRGVFDTVVDATAWAETNLEGNEYEIRRIDPIA